MSELRDRIAAALRNMTGSNPSGHPITYEGMADAVIAELGLKTERCPCAYRGPNCATRYVTDWKADA